MARSSLVPTVTALAASALLVLDLASPAARTAKAQQPKADEADAMFQHLDSNSDGRLSMADANDGNRAMLQKILSMANKPDTGSVKREEFQQVFDRHRGQNRSGAEPRPPVPGETSAVPLPALFRHLDTDHNGRLSRGEWEQLAQLFQRLDTNGDGAIDADEWRAALGSPSRGASPSPTPQATPDRPAADGATAAGPAKAGAAKADSPANPRSAGKMDAGKTTAGQSDTSVESRLNGSWRGWVVDGRGEHPDTGAMELELQVAGRQITAQERGTRRAGDGLGAGTFQLAGSATEGTIDAVATSGPNQGRQFLGIFQLEGDTLRWCSADKNRPRPSEFATGQGNYLMILHRQRP